MRYASHARDLLGARSGRLLAERVAASVLLAGATLALPGRAPLAAAVLLLGAGSGAIAVAAHRWLGTQHRVALAWAGLALDLALASAFVYATGGASSPAAGLYLLVLATPSALADPRAAVAAGPAAATAFVATAALQGPFPAHLVLFPVALLAAGGLAAARVQIERRGLLREHDRRVQELAAINSVAHELTAILDPNALTWRVVGLVRERFGHPRVRIGIRAGDTIAIRATDASATESWPLDSPALVAEATRTGAAVVRFAGPSEADALAIPLLAGGRPIGALEVEAAPGTSFRARDIRSLEAVAAFTAIAIENAEMHQSALRSALTDPLTGLFNVRYLQETLGGALARAETAGRPFSLLMLDVDNLREVNNRYGHLTGDLALQEVARVIAHVTRGGDIAARYGGDEFLLALPDADPDAAAAVAERIRREVAAIRLAPRGEPVTITLSIGVASHPADGRTLDALIEAADRAAYRAKARGRNRIALLASASPETGPAATPSGDRPEGG